MRAIDDARARDDVCGGRLAVGCHPAASLMFEFARARAVDRDRASIEAIEIIFISWIARFQREIDGSRAVSIASLDVPRLANM